MVCQLTAAFPGRGTASVLLVRAACICLPRAPESLWPGSGGRDARPQCNLFTSLAMLNMTPSTTGADRKSSAKNRILLQHGKLIRAS